MRDVFAALFELIGVAALVAAGYVWCFPAGLAASGAALILVGYLVEPDGPEAA